MKLEVLDDDLLGLWDCQILTYGQALQIQCDRTKALDEKGKADAERRLARIDMVTSMPKLGTMQEERLLDIDTVRAMVEGDIEHVEQLLSELERGPWMPYIRANLSQAALDLRLALERLQEAQSYEEKR